MPVRNRHRNKCRSPSLGRRQELQGPAQSSQTDLSLLPLFEVPPHCRCLIVPYRDQRPSSPFSQHVLTVEGRYWCPGLGFLGPAGHCSVPGRNLAAPVLLKVGCGHNPAPMSLTAPPSCATALPQLCQPSALTRRVDGVQCHLPGSYEPAHLLQVPLLDVVLKDYVVGEAHGARGPEARRVPAVPRHQGAIVPHADRSLQTQRHGGLASTQPSPSLHCRPLLPVRGPPCYRSVLAPRRCAPAVPLPVSVSPRSHRAVLSCTPRVTRRNCHLALAAHLRALGPELIILWEHHVLKTPLGYFGDMQLMLFAMMLRNRAAQACSLPLLGRS